jgi:lipopolysaccharide/colanic/teichoic acid biosynthesis glycosyltransferase
MNRRDDYRMLAKRALDILVSAGLIILTLPVMALVALLVKFDSCGPAIFKGTRIGINKRRTKAFNGGGVDPGGERRREDLGGRPFTMYKFRSMVQEAQAMLPSLVNLGALTEPVYKLEDDPRVTRFGTLLRKTSLDELPQLFNVLKGDMSLVGPRPEDVEIVRLYEEKHKKRLLVKPGLTGLQQINCRGTLSMDARLEYDIHYMKHQSMWMDIWILIRTVYAVMKCNGAC